MSMFDPVVVDLDSEPDSDDRTSPPTVASSNPDCPHGNAMCNLSGRHRGFCKGSKHMRKAKAGSDSTPPRPSTPSVGSNEDADSVPDSDDRTSPPTVASSNPDCPHGNAMCNLSGRHRGFCKGSKHMRKAKAGSDSTPPRPSAPSVGSDEDADVVGAHGAEDTGRKKRKARPPDLRDFSPLDLRKMRMPRNEPRQAAGAPDGFKPKADIRRRVQGNRVESEESEDESEEDTEDEDDEDGEDDHDDPVYGSPQHAIYKCGKCGAEKTRGGHGCPFDSYDSDKDEDEEDEEDAEDAEDEAAAVPVAAAAAVPAVPRAAAAVPAPDENDSFFSGRGPARFNNLEQLVTDLAKENALSKATITSTFARNELPEPLNGKSVLKAILRVEKSMTLIYKAMVNEAYALLKAAERQGTTLYENKVQMKGGRPTSRRWPTSSTSTT